MGDFWKTKEFKALSRKWDQKLRDSGFIDVEHEVKGDRVLINYDSNVYRSNATLQVSSKVEFFTLIGHWVANDPNMAPRDRSIMDMYSRGFAQKEILEHLKKEGLSCNRITITRTITRYLMKWRIPSKPRKTK